MHFAGILLVAQSYTVSFQVHGVRVAMGLLSFRFFNFVMDKLMENNVGNSSGSRHQPANGATLCELDCANDFVCLSEYMGYSRLLGSPARAIAALGIFSSSS